MLKRETQSSKDMTCWSTDGITAEEMCVILHLSTCMEEVLSLH